MYEHAELMVAPSQQAKHHHPSQGPRYAQDGEGCAADLVWLYLGQPVYSTLRLGLDMAMCGVSTELPETLHPHIE